MVIQYNNSSETVLKFFDQLPSEDLEYETFEQYYDQLLVPSNPGYYNYRKEKGLEKIYLSNITRFQSIQEVFLEYATTISDVIEQSTKRFLEFFPDFFIDDEVMIVHSFGEFDGAVRSINGKKTLLFGLDLIATIHQGHNISPLIHHELFHLYHQKFYTRLESRVDKFFTEGLATYISKVLNPEATPAQLMLMVPIDIGNKVRENKEELKVDILNNLDNLQPNFLAKMFTGPFSDTHYRAGYYIGYIFCKYLAETYSLHELVLLDHDIIMKHFKDFLEYNFNDLV